MNAKKLRFIFLLTLVSVLIFLAGEILLLFVFNNNSSAVSLGWLIAVVVVTVVISAWKCPRDYEDDDNSNEKE